MLFAAAGLRDPGYGYKASRPLPPILPGFPGADSHAFRLRLPARSDVSLRYPLRASVRPRARLPRIFRRRSRVCPSVSRASFYSRFPDADALPVLLSLIRPAGVLFVLYYSQSPESNHKVRGQRCFSVLTDTEQAVSFCFRKERRLRNTAMPTVGPRFLLR